MINKCHYFKVMMISATMLLCASSSYTAEEDTRTILDFKTFTVAFPNSSDWSISVDESKRSVEALRQKKWWTGRVLGSTLIKVFENRVLEKGERKSSQEEAASHYIASEEKILSTAAHEGNYALESTVRGTAEIGGKTFYTLAYKIKQGRLFLGGGASQIIEAVLYIWIPQEFPQTGLFYGFLISESYERGALVKADLNQILPIIESFSIKP